MRLLWNEAMIAMAVESANDAAVVVAEHLGGSLEGFVEMMNRRARELGMENTRFVNPTACPKKGREGNVSTAYDIALMSGNCSGIPNNSMDQHSLGHPVYGQGCKLPTKTSSSSATTPAATASGLGGRKRRAIAFRQRSKGRNPAHRRGHEDAHLRTEDPGCHEFA